MSDLYRAEIIPSRPGHVGGGYVAWLPVDVLRPGWDVARRHEAAARRLADIQERIRRLVDRRDHLDRTRQRGGAFGDGMYPHPRHEELGREIDKLQAELDEAVEERGAAREELDDIARGIVEGYVAVRVGAPRLPRDPDGGFQR